MKWRNSSNNCNCIYGVLIYAMETRRGSLAVWRKPGKLVGLGSPREFESLPRRLSLFSHVMDLLLEAGSIKADALVSIFLY